MCMKAAGLRKRFNNLTIADMWAWKTTLSNLSSLCNSNLSWALNNATQLYSKISKLSTKTNQALFIWAHLWLRFLKNIVIITCCISLTFSAALQCFKKLIKCLIHLHYFNDISTTRPYYVMYLVLFESP